MTEIITEPRLVAKYQRQLVKYLKTVCTQKVDCVVGYQGDSHELRVYYSEKFNFWFTSHENDNRYWNGFGFGRPVQGRNSSITVEINIPFRGINRNVGGAFAQNGKGEVIIVHRGKIGGGRVGIGKQLFFKNFRDEPIIVEDGGFENEFCLVGALGTKYLARQVANFVSEVHRIKSLDKEEASGFSSLSEFSFTAERTGTKKVKRTGTTVIERTHGIVVNSLATLLEEKGFKIAKDVNRDLFVHKRGRITKLFEIKRSSSTQSLYSAVGQLIIYSIPIKTSVDLILVFPERLKKSVENRLKALGMKVLYYDWNNGDPVFKNLDAFL